MYCLLDVHLKGFRSDFCFVRSEPYLFIVIQVLLRGGTGLKSFCQARQLLQRVTLRLLVQRVTLLWLCASVSTAMALLLYRLSATSATRSSLRMDHLHQLTVPEHGKWH